MAGGLFPSKEAALEAAVVAFRTQFERAPPVPAEHLELVEHGLASIEAGRRPELADADLEAFRQRAAGIALRHPSGSA